MTTGCSWVDEDGKARYSHPLTVRGEEYYALLRVAHAARKHYGADVALDAALDALDEVSR